MHPDWFDMDSVISNFYVENTNIDQVFFKVKVTVAP
jgi:hypothetical protein